MDIYIPVELLVAVTATLPYWPLLYYRPVPVYDDDPVIRDTMRSWTRFPWKIRPRFLSWWSIVLNAKIGAERGWFLLNLTLHAIFAVILYRIAVQFVGPFPAALGTTVAAWHPGALMAVTQVVLGRPSVMCAIGLLGAAWALIAGTPFIALPLAVFAWASKEEAWAMPVVLALVAVSIAL